MNDQDLLQLLVSKIFEILRPLVTAAEDRRMRDALLEALQLPLNIGPDLSLPSIPSDALERIDQYLKLQETNPSLFFKVIDDILAVVTAIRSFVETAYASAGRDVTPELVLEGADAILNLLTISHIHRRAPRFYAALRLLGFIEEQISAHHTQRLLVERIGDLLRDVKGYFKQLYNPQLDIEEEVKKFSDALYIPVMIAFNVMPGLAANVRAIYEWDADPNLPLTLADTISKRILAIEVKGNSIQNGGTDAESELEGRMTVATIIVPKIHQGPGVIYSFAGDGALEAPIGKTWKLKIELGSTGAFDLFFTGNGPATSTAADASIVFTFSRDEREAGSRAAFFFFDKKKENPSRFEFGKAILSFEMSNTDIVLKAVVRDSALVIDRGGADSFINHFIPEEGIRADFNLGIGWSRLKQRIFLEGGASLISTIPINKIIGPLHIQSILLGIQPVEGDSNSAVRVEALAAFTLTFGPIAASVDRIGLAAKVSFPEGGGRLWVADLDLDFQPPKGLGLAIDAESFTGGGFLSFDPDNGRYAGVLQLQFSRITLNAFGLLDTKLPGGESGFSFLILISTEFNPPIQLGLGFKLSKVGGLAGINRAVDENVLQKGLRNRTLDHILFAKDPLRNAPQIISDLRAVFPPAEGSYVFGPIAAITWGTPTLIEAEVGIVLQISNSIRLFLLGQINALIPPAVPGSPQKPIIELHLDIVGFIDFDQKRLEIDTVLRDSRVVGYPLSGDAALRLNWGDEPLFIFSIGGLHPRFTPPPNFPKLSRLTVLLGTGNSPRITLELYLAITSNTFQVGARAEMQVGGKYNLHGWLSFDALFIFSPFSFTALITAGLDLRRNKKVLAGVHLEITLSGPSPWRAKGEACISLLFFDVCVDFDETFGESIEFIPPVVDPTVELLKAVSDVGNWSASLPVAVERVVTTAASKIIAPKVLVDPMGAVALHQRVLPFNVSISKFGEARVEKPGPYLVPSVKVGSQVYGKPDSAGEGKKYSLVKDSFAPGQFVDLSESEKLSRPSFEKMDAGVAIASDALKMGKAIQANVVYETIIIDSPFDGPPPLYFLNGVNLLSMNDRGAVALGAFNTTGARKFAPDPRSPAFVGLADDAFVIVGADDLSRRLDITDSSSTKGAAHNALNDYLTAHPQERDQWQVIPRHEL